MKAMAVPFLKSMFALALFAGLQGTVQAQQCAQAAYSNSWAGGNLAAPAMLVGVKACTNGSSTTGAFNVTTAAYNAHGQCSAVCFSSDSAGRHATVKASVVFNSKKPAIATIVMTEYPNGTGSEGVEIRDAASGAILATTGRDSQGHLLELPVIRGSIFLSGAAAQ